MAQLKALNKVPIKVLQYLPSKSSMGVFSRQNDENSLTKYPDHGLNITITQIASDSKKVQQMVQQRIQMITHENSYKFKYELACLNRMNDACKVLHRSELKVQRLRTMTDNLRLLKMNNPSNDIGSSTIGIIELMQQQIYTEVTEALDCVAQGARNWFAEFGKHMKMELYLVNSQGNSQIAVEWRKTTESAMIKTKAVAQSLHDGISEAETTDIQSKQNLNAEEEEEEEEEESQSKVPWSKYIVICKAFLTAGYIILQNLQRCAL